MKLDFKNILVLIFLSFIINGLEAQKFQQFSDDNETFLKQLNGFFTKVTVKENKDSCASAMLQFTEFWNSGIFTKEIKENTKSICNVMLTRRMKAYPEFYHYVSSLNGLMDYDHPVSSYYAWHNSIDAMVNSRRSLKPLTMYLEASHNILQRNIIYESRATSWVSNTLDFEFVYDSVPQIDFKSFNLVCYANRDSTIIYETQGSYFPIKTTWVGNQGKVSWRRAGFREDEIYAELDKYEINLRFSRYDADSVRFYHTKYWDKPLLGQLQEKVLADVTEKTASYPRFQSYFMHVTIDDLFKDINFGGGIEMKGAKLMGIGDIVNDAYISIFKDDEEFINIRSQSFAIRVDRISSSLSSAAIRFDGDSIYHPALQVNYVDENRELSLMRVGEGTTRSPFFDSFHSVDIYTEAIYWKMDEAVIDFETTKGVSGESQATFESVNYFSQSRFDRLQGIDRQNPLLSIKKYADRFNLRDVYVQGLSEFMMMPQEQVIALLVSLANKGFIIYDRGQKKAFIKDKLFDYIDAANKKIDYDVIRFNSKVIAFQNASLELDSFGMMLYGVPKVILSDSQNVFIYPEREQILLKRGMNFIFTGRVHAGMFDIYAKQSSFVYNQFKLDMPVIDSLSFMVKSFEVDGNGKHHLVRVKNVIADIGGDLLIDEPNNKSGLKDYPEYPIFSSTKDAYVYYDDPDIYNGVYVRDTFYFCVYPFTIDSLDNFDTKNFKIEGYLASAGIFPDIEEDLKVQPDYSLGFQARTPPEGLSAYQGKGTYFNDIDLSNRGLKGGGSLSYLTSTSWSDEFRFFPDSCNALAKNFTLREQLTPNEFPNAKGIDADLHWEPSRDFMTVSSNEYPLDMFNQQSELYGKLVLTPEELKGAGLMGFEDAEMTSLLYKFKHHEIFADTADFNLKSLEYDVSAFSTLNYKSHIDFNERKGEFVSNGGASIVNFPVNQYICMLDEFEWFMDSYEIAIGSLEKQAEMAQYNDLSIQELIDVPIQGSEFISVHPDQDSLRFISTTSTYNLKDYILYAEDVKYIRVADAALFPGDRRVVIMPNAHMNTMEKVKILANTVTRYHEIYDAYVNIQGRKEYSGIGYYDYIDQTGYNQKILLTELGNDLTYQTIAKGHVSDSVGFSLSNDFDFSGDIRLAANNEYLNFDGGFRIRHTCNPGRRSWVQFTSEVNPQDIHLGIQEKLSDFEDNRLASGIMFSPEANRFYSGFLSKKRQDADFSVLSASGQIKFDNSMEIYHIGPKNYLNSTSLEGNHLSLERRQCILTGEGKLDLGTDFGLVNMTTYGKATHYIIPDSTSFQLVLGLDFPFEDKALELIVENISGKNLQGLNLNNTVFLKAITDILGEKNAEKIIADLKLFGRFRKYPSELEHTIMFSDVKFSWNYATRSYVSYGPIGIGSIGKTQLNRYVDGYIEIAKKKTGDVINIYLEFERGRYWYYFNYRNNLLQTISSNTEYNNMIREMKEQKKTSKGGKEDDDTYRFSISNLRKKTDFLRRIKF